LQELIYFDNSATTKMYSEALEEMNRIYKNFYGNPSSLHKIGSDAEKVLQNARETIAKTLGVSDKEIFFTSGGTESNNWAIKGSARANKKRAPYIVTSKTEHASVIECFSYLETEGLFPEFLEVSSDGLLDPGLISEKIHDQTSLVSFIIVNSETGAIQNTEQLIRSIRLKNPKTIIHIDAVQAYGKIPLNLSMLDVDLASVSAHKIHGPKGCGALYIKNKTRINPVLHGGGQERKFRSGTENVPAIHGFATAADIIHDRMDDNIKNNKLLKSIIIDGLIKNFGRDGFFINSPENAYEGILNISFPRVKAQVLMQHLEALNIFVSIGSACSSHKNVQSHVLKAMNLPKENIDGAIRLSFSGDNTADEAKRFIEATKEIISVIKY
jgi:cysteine desulfurase